MEPVYRKWLNYTARMFEKCENELGPEGFNQLVVYLQENPCKTPSGETYETLPSELMRNLPMMNQGPAPHECLKSYHSIIESLADKQEDPGLEGSMSKYAYTINMAATFFELSEGRNS